MLPRRQFLLSASSITLGFTGLHRMLGAKSGVDSLVDAPAPLVPDPDRILDLPEDFSYRLVAVHGEEMNDGLLRPGQADGMAAFSGKDGNVVLVCNHESSANEYHLGPFGQDSERAKLIDPSLIANHSANGRPFNGGTTTLVWDPRSRTLQHQHLSLAGTERNCAGGPTPWGSWVTCEEPGDLTAGKIERQLGYCYDVPANAGLVKPERLRAMGRFRHEAIAVDPKSGVVFETEDRDEGLLYRFLPKKPGKLAQGGRLQALAIKGQQSMDLRNWDKNPTVRPGDSLDVEWVDLDEIESPNDDLRLQGFEDKGAARFARGEGCWTGNDGIYIASTTGGQKKLGQIWRYRPSADEGTPGEAKNPGTLELFLEPNDRDLLQNGDNVTVAPWGDLVICEDHGMGSRVLGVTPEGKVYVIASNPYIRSEFAGGCFAPNLSTLFVNVQYSGATYAIDGPWDRLRG